jgi:hypothetical protein
MAFGGGAGVEAFDGGRDLSCTVSPVFGLDVMLVSVNTLLPRSASSRLFEEDGNVDDGGTAGGGTDGVDGNGAFSGKTGSGVVSIGVG